MKQIEQAGKLDEWCRDSVEWMKRTYGSENVVSAVLHMDEETPHIHATPHPYRPDQTQKEEVGKTGEEELPQEAERCSTAVSQ